MPCPSVLCVGLHVLWPLSVPGLVEVCPLSLEVSCDSLVLPLSVRGDTSKTENYENNCVSSHLPDLPLVEGESRMLVAE